MKRALAIVTVVLVHAFWFAAISHAEVPSLFPVDGYLTDNDGKPVSRTQNIAFRLYDAATKGTVLHEETIKVALTKGAFSVYLGADSKHPLSLERMRDARALYVGITVGDDDELAPRLQLGSVPFAAQANYCEDSNTLEGFSASEFAPLHHKHAATDISGGPASGLDADTLDGKHAAALASGVGYSGEPTSSASAPLPLSVSPVTTVSSLELEIPSDGYVVVTASATISLNQAVTSGGTICSISEQPDMHTDGQRSIPISLHAPAFYVSFATTIGFQVDKGAKDFYLVCSSASNVAAAGSAMTAVFSASKL